MIENQIKPETNESQVTLPCRQSKKERAYYYILANPNGVTENDILLNMHLSSGRNYPNELERKYKFKFARTLEPNPDGIGGHTRYRISSYDSALKVLKAINHKRQLRKAPLLQKSEVNTLLAPYFKSSSQNHIAEKIA